MNANTIEANLELEKLKHSSAHVLAQAVLRLFPGSKLGIGPATDTGFYYDIEIANQTEEISDEKKLLGDLEAEINRIIEEELPFTQIFLDRSEALDMLHQQGQIYKSELLHQIEEGEISFYKTGEEFIDLCRGPHVNDTGKIGAVKLKSIEQVHWLGDESRPLLTRINGIAFKSKDQLAEYELEQASLANRNHLLIGESCELFIPEDIQGSKIFSMLTRGTKLKNILKDRMVDIFEAEDYQLIEIKHLWNKMTFSQNELAGFYKLEQVHNFDNTFTITNSEIAQVMAIAQKQAKSQGAKLKYLFETKDYLSTKNDDAASGNLYNSQLTDKLKLIEITNQADAKTVLSLYVQLILTYYRKLGLEIYLKVNGDDDELLNSTIQIAQELNLKISKSTNSNQFSVKLLHRDIFENEWELATITSNPALNDYIKKLLQIHNLDLEYLFELELITNVERLLAILIEKFDGALPFDIAPYQIVILPESESHYTYAKSLKSLLKANNLRTVVDLSKEAFVNKLQQAQKFKYPYILTVGEQEENNNVFSVKPHTGEDLGLMSLKEFLQKLSQVS